MPEPDQGSNPMQWFFGTGLGASLGLVVWLAAQSNPLLSRAVPPPIRGLPPAAAHEPARSDDKPVKVEPAPKLDPTEDPGVGAAPEPAPEPTDPTRAESPTQDQPVDDQPTAAALAAQTRKLQEAERDRRRHEAVTRDLQKLSAAAARRSVTINMYSTSWCGVCARARAYMKQKNIPFQEFDIEQDAQAAARAAQINPRGSVPTIVIDDDVLIGFSPSLLEARLDRAAQRRAVP